ncbi:heavy metal translocating P-type ATPase [Actinomycetospora sp. OC33-EN08]|uniref:Heavy metal translocating P-type ATPase n=1 Tax=Actinomycetospora aurantiaca TaxID=3129233 RepID=A0ABU8MYJ1_9PSEU
MTALDVRPAPPAGPPRRPLLVRLPEARRAGLALAAFIVGGLLVLLGAPAWSWGPILAASYVAGGWEPAVEGLRALRERRLDVDLLMVVAALGAAGIGQVVDGALLIVIFATSGALEAWATARTEESVGGLLDLAPSRATRLTGDAEEEVRAEVLAVGDVVLVRPGDAIPADGLVLDGAAEVDQSSITGEPLPVPKGAGSEVYGGTIAAGGALRVRVARPAGESVVARIAALVEEASRTKARTQLFIEKVEQRYSVGIVVATLVIFAVPLGLGATLDDALLRAMTFMIVASPCALVLATMPPLLAAVAHAGRRGLLVRSAQVMERLGAVDAVVLDKTGTVTVGAPRVVGEPADDVLALAAAVETPSEHPLGRAVVAAARERDLAIDGVTDFVAEPGVGVRGTVRGRRVGVGRADTGSREPADHEQDGAITLVDVTDLGTGRVLGRLGIADTVRPDAARAVADLAGRTVVPPVLATGDRAPAAEAMAARLGITDARADLLPEDKVAVVADLRAQGRTVAVVGDGVNDAPALAGADVGIAVGRAELTVRTADVVVLGDDLGRLPWLLDLGRRARRTVVANLVLAGTIIVGLVTWDLVGHLPLALGVAGHEGSTILVALNGLRLLRGGRRGVTAGRRP